jgi:enamine deaminase RidA (YjgF/YER057c/UK114 family)
MEVRMSVERVDLSADLGVSPGYAYAAKARGGTHVYTAGSVPVDRDGNLIAPGDLEGQTRAVIANLELVLDRTGVTPEDVVKTTIYVAAGEQADLPRVWRIFAETPLAAAPSTLLGVPFLGYSGQLVEIEAVAITGVP